MTDACVQRKVLGLTVVRAVAFPTPTRSGNSSDTSTEVELGLSPFASDAHQLRFTGRVVGGQFCPRP